MAEYNKIQNLKAVEVKQDPYTSWRKGNEGKKMPGWIRIGEADVFIDWHAVRSMARRAMCSKGKQCRDGALLVKVHHISQSEIPAEQ